MLLVKISEMVKSQPDTVTNVATTQVASQPNKRSVIATYGTIRNELKTLKAHRYCSSKVPKTTIITIKHTWQTSE